MSLVVPRKTGSGWEIVTSGLRGGRVGEIQPWRVRFLQVITGRPCLPVRGHLGLPKRGLVAPGSGTDVSECVRLALAVNWVWRGRPGMGSLQQLVAADGGL